MVRTTFGCRVRGTSHKATNTPCQDSFLIKEHGRDVLIMAVADGHGSQACPHSAKGSRIATKIFYRTMRDLYEAYFGDPEKLLTYLNREGAIRTAQTIDIAWKRAVELNHRKTGISWPSESEIHPLPIASSRTKRPYPKSVDVNNNEELYRQYGTTLVGLMITPVFFFAFQLGDGDIIYVDNYGAEPVITSEKILGVETHSLCKTNAWERAITVTRRHNASTCLPYAFMLSTDGFANSYADDREFQKTCNDYFNVIKEHGTDVVRDNLEEWLSETSEQGCGDDITFLFTFCSAETMANEIKHPENNSHDRH